MALTMGFGGLYFSYLSGRQTVKPRLVGFFLILGLLLIAGAIYIELYVYSAKVGVFRASSSSFGQRPLDPV